MYKNLIVILALINCIPANGQDMLIEQIAGKEVVRKAFNTDKELTAKQVFRVGELQTTGNQLSVQLQVNLFDEEGNLKDKYLTQYTCEPGKSDVLLAVFPFARQGNAAYVIEASSPGFKRLYDFDADDRKLENLSLEMSVESGILSFFGSKSIITINDRIVSTTGRGFTLTSRLTVKAYMWGVNVKTITYQVTEKLDKKRRLISQVFLEEDGSYFLMNY
tara:strand:- start:159 stop:815 length:657 start_codon:yes stop_codon:yes gene_type:complete